MPDMELGSEVYPPLHPFRIICLFPKAADAGARGEWRCTSQLLEQPAVECRADFIFQGLRIVIYLQWAGVLFGCCSYLSKL
jgi:hypothetical protein